MRLSALCRSLVGRGYQVCIACLRLGQEPVQLMDGVTAFASHSPRGGIPILRFLHPRLTSWWRALDRANADIYIQSCAGYLTALTALYCRIKGKKFIYSGACDPDFDLTQTANLFRRRAGLRDKILYLWGLRQAHAIITQHKGQTEALRRYHALEGIEIPNGYSAPIQATPTNGVQKGTTPLVLWVATLRSWKQPHFFLELARRLPGIRFRMIGGPGGEDEAHIYKTISTEAKAIRNLDFRGFIPYSRIDEHFDEAAIFVNTSLYEGFPNTFLQSWARSIPTVSFINLTDAADGESPGISCSDIDQMCSAVESLATHPQARIELGAKAYRYFMQKHSIEHSVQLYATLFSRLLAATPTSAGVRR